MANSTKKRLTLSKKKQVITLNILHNEHLTSCKARRLSQHTIDTYESNYRLLSEFLTEEYDISQLSNKGVHDYINFLSCKARRLSQHTIDTYESNYRLLSEFLTEEYDISQLSNKGVHDYINFLCDNYSSKTTTLNSRLRYVRNLFNFAHEQGYCDKLKIKLIKENVENKTPLTKDEVQKLIARPKSVRFTEVKMWVIANLVLSTGIRSRNVSVENKTPLTKDEVQKLIARPKSVRFTEVKMWVIANLVLSTGIRSRNVREARVSDLDLQNRTLYLRDTKSHKSQTVYLSKSVVKVLNEWLRLTELPSDSPLFPNEFGEEMSLDVCKMAFIRYAQRRGVNTSLHILRHTYARDLVQADVNPVIIKELLGHHSLEVTFIRYAQRRGVNTSLHILRHTYARDLVQADVNPVIIKELLGHHSLEVTQRYYARDLVQADVNPVIIKELLGHHSLEVTQRYIKLFSDDIRKATDGLDTLAQYQKNRIKLGGNK